MVSIAKNFDNDMDDYLNRIYGKKERFTDTVKKKRSKRPIEPAKVPDQVSEEEVFIEYDEDKPTYKKWLGGLFSSKRKGRIPDEEPEDIPVEKLPKAKPDVVKVKQMEDELEEVEDEIGELENRQESLLSRFLRAIRGTPSVDDDEPMQELIPVIDEDVKEVLKRLHSWIEKLPNRELREFKTSEDFELYLAVLEKYELIKKKE